VGDFINKSAPVGSGHHARCGTLHPGPNVVPSGPTQPTNVTSYVWAYTWDVSSARGSSASLKVDDGSIGERQQPGRKIFAWASGSDATVAQLLNSSWHGIFDGVQANCGVKFNAAGEQAGLTLDEAAWKKCAPLRAALKKTGAKLHVWTPGPSAEALKDPAATVKSAVALAANYGIQGFSMDDEFDCAPRSTLARFRVWIKFVNAFADGLHLANPRVELSAAVQAMFGIQDVAYKPLCQPQDQANCSQACTKAPSAYKPNAEVVKLMSDSGIDRWLEMDTYYFGLGRYLDALDWYAKAVPNAKLGVAVMNRNDISDDGYMARFHALEKSGASWLNLFILPADDVWLKYLRRWKSGCKHCPNAGTLSCYEFTDDVKC